MLMVFEKHLGPCCHLVFQPGMVHLERIMSLERDEWMTKKGSSLDSLWGILIWVPKGSPKWEAKQVGWFYNPVLLCSL